MLEIVIAILESLTYIKVYYQSDLLKCDVPTEVLLLDLDNFAVLLLEAAEA